MSQHFEEIYEKLPYFVEFPKQNRSQLRGIHKHLMQKIAEESPIDVGQGFLQSFGGLVPGILGKDLLSKSVVVCWNAFLDDLVQIVKNQPFVLPVFFRLK